MVRAVLSHLPVPCAIVHRVQLTTLHQVILFKTHLALGDQQGKTCKRERGGTEVTRNCKMTAQSPSLIHLAAINEFIVRNKAFDDRTRIYFILIHLIPELRLG